MALANIINDKSKQFNFPLPQAKLYIQLTDNEKSNIDDIVKKYSLELPYIIYNIDKPNPILITKNYLIKFTDNDYLILRLADITGLNSDEQERFFTKQNHPRNLYKFELTKWIVEINNKTKVEVELEKGEAYYSFYHILKKILVFKNILPKI